METAIELEIPLTHFQNIANFKKLVDIAAEKGFLVKDGAVAEWSFSGYRYRDGTPCLFGPPARGIPLAAALERPREESLASAAAVVRSLALIEGADDRIEIFPDSVWLLEDGGVVFLPAEVFRKIRLLSDDEYKARCSRLSDPYAEKPAERLSRSIGVILYRALTGAYPYDGKNLDEIHARIRQRKILPPQFAVPELKKDISEFFRNFFEKKTPFTIAEWKNAVDGWLSSGYTEQRTHEETAELAARREKLVARLDRGYKRGVFLEKYGKTILIAASAVLAAGITAIVFVSNALKPRPTAGFPPLKVVETYYQAIDSLNPELIGACLKGDAGADELRRAEMLFVNNRQLEYYTRRTYRLSAGEWEKLGRPRVTPPSYVDGITRLSLKEISSSFPPVFEAEYERWVYLPADDRKSAPRQAAFRITERLTLGRDEQGWLITRIDRSEHQQIYQSDQGYEPPPPPEP